MYTCILVFSGRTSRCLYSSLGFRTTSSTYMSVLSINILPTTLPVKDMMPFSLKASQDISYMPLMCR